VTADWITDGPVAFNEADLLRSGAKDSFAHSILSVHELVGEVDVPRLSEAYRWIGQRHESFRTAFVHEAKGWRRRVHLVPRLALEHIDLSAGPDAEASARALLSERFVRPFDRAVALWSGPPCSPWRRGGSGWFTTAIMSSWTASPSPGASGRS
jgi:hypothetical protein